MEDGTQQILQDFELPSFRRGETDDPSVEAFEQAKLIYEAGVAIALGTMVRVHRTEQALRKEKAAGEKGVTEGTEEVMVVQGEGDGTKDARVKEDGDNERHVDGDAIALEGEQGVQEKKHESMATSKAVVNVQKQPPGPNLVIDQAFLSTKEGTALSTYIHDTYLQAARHIADAFLIDEKAIRVTDTLVDVTSYLLSLPIPSSSTANGNACPWYYEVTVCGILWFLHEEAYSQAHQWLTKAIRTLPTRYSSRLYELRAAVAVSLEDAEACEEDLRSALSTSREGFVEEMVAPYKDTVARGQVAQWRHRRNRKMMQLMDPGKDNGNNAAETREVQVEMDKDTEQDKVVEDVVAKVEALEVSSGEQRGNAEIVDDKEVLQDDSATANAMRREDGSKKKRKRKKKQRRGKRSPAVTFGGTGPQRKATSANGTRVDPNLFCSLGSIQLERQRYRAAAASFRTYLQSAHADDRGRSYACFALAQIQQVAEVGSGAAAVALSSDGSQVGGVRYWLEQAAEAEDRYRFLYGVQPMMTPPKMWAIERRYIEPDMDEGDSAVVV